MPQSRELLLVDPHRLACVALNLCLVLFSLPAVQQMVGDTEVPSYLSHRPCRVANRTASVLNSSEYRRRVLVVILPSNFILLFLMRVSVKSGEGQLVSLKLVAGHRGL